MPAGTQLECVILREEFILREVAGELFTDGATLAKTGARAIACLVHVRIDLGAARGHGARGGRVGRQRIERAVRRREPVWQALRKRMRSHPLADEIPQGGVHQSLPCTPLYRSALSALLR